MPVRQYNSIRPPEQGILTERLAKEWETPDPAADEPVILEENSRQGEIVHVYVVWSDWAHLNRLRRGEIIMDAAEQVKPDEASSITIAMGLTPDEADRFGIKWR